MYEVATSLKTVPGIALSIYARQAASMKSGSRRNRDLGSSPSFEVGGPGGLNEERFPEEPRLRTKITTSDLDVRVSMRALQIFTPFSTEDSPTFTAKGDLIRLFDQANADAVFGSEGALARIR